MVARFLVCQRREKFFSCLSPFGDWIRLEKAHMYSSRTHRIFKANADKGQEVVDLLAECAIENDNKVW